jgi:hypothetical protein
MPLCSGNFPGCLRGLCPSEPQARLFFSQRPLSKASRQKRLKASMNLSDLTDQGKAKPV